MQTTPLPAQSTELQPTVPVGEAVFTPFTTRIDNPMGQRLPTIDFIRGFALLGILMMNIMGFARLLLPIRAAGGVRRSLTCSRDNPYG